MDATIELARSNPDFDAGDRFLDQWLSQSTIREDEFTLILIKAARAFYGWRVIHIRRARTATGWVTPIAGDGKGFPDLLMIRKQTGQQVAAELKIGKNEKTEDQTAWLDDFEDCGTPSFTWRPTDIEEIKHVLRHGIDMAALQAL